MWRFACLKCRLSAAPGKFRARVARLRAITGRSLAGGAEVEGAVGVAAGAGGRNTLARAGLLCASGGDGGGQGGDDEGEVLHPERWVEEGGGWSE